MSATANGSATWTTANEGNVALTGYGWELCSLEAVSADLNSNPNPDWRYRFTADGNGAFALTYDVDQSGGTDPTGLNGFTLFWTDFADPSSDTSFTIGLGDSGSFSRSLVAGEEYEVSLKNNASTTRGAGAPVQLSASMDGQFSWLIQTSGPPPPLPEPGSLALLGAALAAFAFTRRRRC